MAVRLADPAGAVLHHIGRLPNPLAWPIELPSFMRRRS
jgi:hypothetical protein